MRKVGKIGPNHLNSTFKKKPKDCDSWCHKHCTITPQDVNKYGGVPLFQTSGKFETLFFKTPSIILYEIIIFIQPNHTIFFK